MNRKNRAGFISAIFLCCLVSVLLLSGCSGVSYHHSDESNIALDTLNQEKNVPVPEDSTFLAALYSQAIGDYIQLVSKKYRLSFDTLYFGKRVSGQPDDFPDIQLQSVISDTHIKLISEDQGIARQREDKLSFYVNLIAWVNAGKAEFIFVTFSNGMAHQFDCIINYEVHHNKYGITGSQFKNYQFKAK